MSTSTPGLTRFEWDPRKDHANRLKHGVPFALAQFAFADPRRVIAEDTRHGGTEQRWFCFGVVDGGVVTVRFTWRDGTIRIIGAGYWRKGKAIYEQQNPLP
ncbi:MAG: BrnT family toxin [Burkholderiales bacterium]